MIYGYKEHGFGKQHNLTDRYNRTWIITESNNDKECINRKRVEKIIENDRSQVHQMLFSNKLINPCEKHFLMFPEKIGVLQSVSIKSVPEVRMFPELKGYRKGNIDFENRNEFILGKSVFR